MLEGDKFHRKKKRKVLIRVRGSNKQGLVEKGVASSSSGVK